MSNKPTTLSLNIVVGCALAIVALGGAVGPSQSANTVALGSLPYEPTHYGLIYLYPYHAAQWEPGDVPAMRAALQQAKNMGVTTIVQVFDMALKGSGNESHWRLFLDAAQEFGISVVAHMWPENAYTGNPDDPFYYGDLKAFLDVAVDHPALIGYLGLHQPLDPYKGISGDQLKGFYTEMKNYAPNLKIAHYMGDMAYWEAHRTDGWTFSDGVCDICIVWYYPFSSPEGTPIYEKAAVLQTVQSNLALRDEHDPDAELWFMGQAFAQQAHERHLRMPTPDEMMTLYLDVMQEPVDGFMWYPWIHGMYMDERLGDPGHEAQQEEVQVIAETYVRLPKVYLPLVGKLW